MGLTKFNKRMFMKALKSELAKKILKAGVRIPVKDGAKFVFEGKEYTVKHVPKASWIYTNSFDF